MLQMKKITRENWQDFQELAPLDVWERADLAFGTMESDEACGLLVTEWQDEDVFITYLYVKDAFRRKKIATKLVDTLRFAGQLESRATLQCNYVSGEATRSLEDFFDYLCFASNKEKSPLYRIRLGDLKKEYLSRKIQLHAFEKIVPLGELSSAEWMKFVRYVRQMQQYDTQGIFPYLESRSKYHRSYSFLFLTVNICVGCILVREQSGYYVIEFLWNSTKRPSIDVICLLQAAYQAMSHEHDEDTVLCVNPLTKKSSAIINYFSRTYEKMGDVITRSYIY